MKDKFKALVGEENHGQHHRFSDIYSIFHDPHSGLAKNESSLLMSKLLNTNIDAFDHTRSKSTVDFDKYSMNTKLLPSVFKKKLSVFSFYFQANSKHGHRRRWGAQKLR